MKRGEGDVLRLRLHINPNCPACARRAASTERLDWLNRIETRTDASPLGEVPPGEIVVVDDRRGRAFTGVFAIRELCLRIPLLCWYGLLLCLPPVLDIAGRNVAGRSVERDI